MATEASDDFVWKLLGTQTLGILNLELQEFWISPFFFLSTTVVFVYGYVDMEVICTPMKKKKSFSKEGEERKEEGDTEGGGGDEEEETKKEEGDLKKPKKEKMNKRMKKEKTKWKYGR